ncbi:MAG: ABC transporter permease [Angelakisella sp.]|jgi:putative ABC transport system permease protein
MNNPITLLYSLPGALAQGLIWGIMAIGVAITYKILDYADLTVDNSLCTGGAVAAICIIGGMDPLLSLVFAMLAGALAGLCTGLLHTVLGIPAILSGILTQLALYSINMHIMGKSNLTISRTQYDLLLTSARIPRAILVSGLFVVVLVIVLYWFFGTQLGCAIRATGNNEHMARAQGISTNRMKVLGLMLSNALVGLSGALLAQYQGNADINMGRGAIVIGLAAVVIGGALLGRRENFALRLATTALGGVVYYAILAVVIWAGLSTSDLKLFSAVVVTVFLSAPHLKKKWAARHPAKGGAPLC